jgi:hypothetical protein
MSDNAALERRAARLIPQVLGGNELHGSCETTNLRIRACRRQHFTQQDCSDARREHTLGSSEDVRPLFNEPRGKCVDGNHLNTNLTICRNSYLSKNTSSLD